MEFSVGNSEDKRRYCDSSFELANIHLIGPARRLWPPVVLRFLAQGTNHLAKTISRRLGSYHSLRRHLRHGRESGVGGQ